MVYYIYKSKQISEKEFLFAYLALKTNESGNIEDFKFKSKINTKNEIPWSFAYTSKGIHKDVKDIDDKSEQILQDNVERMSNLFIEVESNQIKEIAQKSIAATTIKELKSRLIKIKSEEPSFLEFQLAMCMLLIKIAEYFEKNPEELYDFPLFNDYKKKHKLGEDFLVEDFILMIQTGFFAGNSFS